MINKVEFTFHSNEYNRAKNKMPLKKPKWVGEENFMMFHTFSNKGLTKPKNHVTAEKKLIQAGLSFEILEEKYRGTTNMIHLFDLSGCTLWMNKLLKNTCFARYDDTIGNLDFINFIEWNEKNVKLHKSLKSLLIDYPDEMEIQDENMRTKIGCFYNKMHFVKNFKSNFLEKSK